MEAGTEEIVTEIAAVEKLRIRELDEHIPLGNDGFVNESNTFRWYRIRNKNDYHILNTAYRDTIREPSVYPEIICVETVGISVYDSEKVKRQNQKEERRLELWQQMWKVCFM